MTDPELEPKVDEPTPEPEDAPVPTPEDDPEPTPTPEPAPPPPSEQDVEKMLKQMEKESTRHANKVSEIMGEDADALTPCPLCLPSIPGFVYSDFIPDDQRENVLTLLTGASSSDYADDPLTEACDVCNATGRTATGSKVLEHLTRPCPKCIGMGFVDPTRKAQWEGEQALRNPPAPPTPIMPAYTPPNGNMAEQDAWGRPRSHWLYGKDPRYLTDAERASDLPHIAAG